MAAHHHHHDHDHGHVHAHVHHSNLLGWAVVITLGFAAVEAIGGWWAKSLALLGDAGHMLSDATALGLAALAAWLARRPPSARHSYGFGRAEVLAAIINAIAMLAIVIGIVIAAVQRFATPQPVEPGPVVVIAIIGLVINIGLAYLLSRGEQTLNVRAALLHVFGDLLGSVAALVAGAVIYFTGWMPIDPLLSVLICLLILASAVRIVWDSLHVLMEGVPRHLDLNSVGRAVAEIPDVRSVHDLHIWTLSSGHVALSAHVVIDDMARWPALLPRITELLHERFHIDHSTLQPEPSTHILQRLPYPPNRDNATELT